MLRLAVCRGVRSAFQEEKVATRTTKMADESAGAEANGAEANGDAFAGVEESRDAVTSDIKVMI